VQEGSPASPNSPESASTLSIGVFVDRDHAREAIVALEHAGVEPEAISVLARTPAEARSLERETGASDELGNVTGHHRIHNWLDWLASIGGAMGGFGPVAGTGNLGLQVARSKTDRGAVTGALVGLGAAVDEAERYEAQVHDGKILIVVHGAADPEAAQAALNSVADRN
jgi:hypothetical protein